jgi:uncharacterized protein (DUF1810 family)
VSDPHNLKRFVDAQKDVYATALAELRAGSKQSHWMWFIFPQLRGLGRSPTAEFYGISSLAEAQAYLSTPHWDHGSGNASTPAFIGRAAGRQSS